MTSEIRVRQFTIAPNTPIATPSVQAMTFPQRQVTNIHWRVPSGPSGLMGWSLQVAGNPVIPLDPGTYIVTDDDSDDWPLENYPDQGQWQFVGYNLDIYPHTVYLQLQLAVSVGPQTTPAQLPSSQLSSPPPAVIPATIPLPDLSVVAV